MTGRTDRWISRTTIGCVAVLALIAGTVSYLHMHELVELHGQPGWVALLTPLSVDGMIVAASTTLLAESRAGGRGGVLPWGLLAVGSIASLAANVAVAQPTVAGRLIAAWPSFALICSYELLMRHARRTAGRMQARSAAGRGPSRRSPVAAPTGIRAGTRSSRQPDGRAGLALQRQAWRWAQDKRASGGLLPSGREIAVRYGRQERWGRLVKRAGLAGELATGDADSLIPRGGAASHVLAVVNEPGGPGEHRPATHARSVVNALDTTRT